MGKGREHFGEIPGGVPVDGGGMQIGSPLQKELDEGLVGQGAPGTPTQNGRKRGYLPAQGVRSQPCLQPTLEKDKYLFGGG